jgi:T-complex protein 1 subunit beta
LISQKIHPQIIISGWRKATQEAVRSLETVTKNNRFAIKTYLEDFLSIYVYWFSLNVEQFKSDLMNIARTTLSSKILQGKKDYFAKLCVDAVLKLHVN